MKKNWYLRIAGLMLALAMITSCFVGSTFAKYVTRAEGSDNARVAKWGIVLTAAGTPLFDTEYETTDDKGYTGLSVLSQNGDKVVAPGTTKDGFEATVFGTPEVAVRYSLHIDGETFKDIVLPAGEGYTDFTNLIQDDDGNWGYFGTFDLEEDYSPLKWDIAVENTNGTKYVLHEFALAYPDLAAQYGLTENGASAHDALVIVQQFKTQLQNLIVTLVSGAQNAQFVVDEETGDIDLSMDFEPGVEMDYTFTLNWTWEFEHYDEEGNVIDLYDMADTWLGNFINYKVFPEECEDWDDAWKAEFDGSEACYELILNVIASATQID